MDLPDAENRLKILRILLASENVESDFQFDKLANDTEGYSGSDLKVLYWLFIFILKRCCCVHIVSISQNLCVAAAYRPVQELLEAEQKVCALILGLCFICDFPFMMRSCISLMEISFFSFAYLLHFKEFVVLKFKLDALCLCQHV